LELQDRHILEALRQGDEQVFEKIFRTYYQRLCNYANTILNSMDEAEEMVQGAFIAVWERHDTLEVHTSIKSYLYRAVHNSCLNRVKHLKVRLKHEETVKYQSDAVQSDASDEMVEKELDAIMANAIDALPSQCRQVFRLSRFENLTYAEIAQQMGISVKTVENHMVKALRVLREKLKDYLPVIIWLLLMKN